MKISSSFLALSIASTAISVLPHAAFSQSTSSKFYGGAFFGSLDVTATSSFGPSPSTGPNMGTPVTNAGALLGWRTNRDSVFYGVEGDISVPFDDVIIGGSGCNGFIPQWCGLSYDAHVRGIVGYEFGKIDVFAGLGLAVAGMSSDSDSSLPSVLTGYSVGLGVEYQLNDRITLRLEDIYDDFGSTSFASPYAGDWSQNTVRAAAIFTF